MGIHNPSPTNRECFPNLNALRYNNAHGWLQFGGSFSKLNGYFDEVKNVIGSLPRCLAPYDYQHWHIEVNSNHVNVDDVVAYMIDIDIGQSLRAASFSTTGEAHASKEWFPQGVHQDMVEYEEYPQHQTGYR